MGFEMNRESLLKRFNEVAEAITQYSAHLNMLMGRKEELTFLMNELAVADSKENKLSQDSKNDADEECKLDVAA